ncbi:phosphatidylethanolamine N-methyltransferase isoform X1 [Petromyzon marinus]|uniref:phosphatidylethanolamine N-methyltransferase isoform X1 n=1 Tax=Petromyzon marinus TaxID=7757 RepID=UPI003F70B997
MHECCGGFGHIDMSKAEFPLPVEQLSQWLTDSVNWTDANLYIALACIVFNPTFWNVVARREHRTRFLTRACCGSAHGACYALAIAILLLGFYRDYRFLEAMRSQPRVPLLDRGAPVYAAGLALVSLGSLLVLASFWALGITGTFLGDYCGILMDGKAAGFPFSVTDNPMYWGSTLNFLGCSLMQASPAGIILTCGVAISYRVAIAFEGTMKHPKNQSEAVTERMTCQPLCKK